MTLRIDTVIVTPFWSSFPFGFESSSKRIEKVAHFIFSLLEDCFQSAAFCLKKAFYPFVRIFDFYGVNYRIHKAFICYQQKKFNQAIDQFQMILGDRHLSDSKKFEVHMKIAKCFRRLARFNKAKYHLELAAQLSRNSSLNKLIEHKLIKIDLLNSEPLINLTPSDLKYYPSWKIVASKTFCERIFTTAQRQDILRVLEEFSQNPQHKAIFDLAAERALANPNEFNILILTPETLKRYYLGNSRIKGFYNSKNSIAIKMNTAFGFGRSEAGCYMHELAHMGAMEKYHKTCPKKQTCYCNPYPCSDVQLKEAFSLAERKMIIGLFHSLKSLSQKRVPDLKHIQSNWALEKKSNEELLPEIHSFFKQAIVKNMLSTDEKLVIETLLSAYNLNDSGQENYSYFERHSELFARVEQLRAEVNNQMAFRYVAPLCEHIEHFS